MPLCFFGVSVSMRIRYLTVKGRLSKYFVKDESGNYYYLYDPSKSSGTGYFLLKKINFYYRLIRVFTIPVENEVDV